jgi:tellurite methyltransferase
MSDPPVAPSENLRAQLGEIDIYLFDQLLKGRFDRRRRILDAGCGHGRNLVYFLRNGFDVFAIDGDPTAVGVTRALATRLRPDLPVQNIRHGPLQVLPWGNESMDGVISSAVLHFVADDHEFARLLTEMWRVLAPGGILFARLASSIGIEPLLPAPTGRVRLPDGSDRFIVNERMLVDWSARLGGFLIEPIKTTNVQNQRCMTTWCLEKR